ncbi:secretin N-terminal domain-containing protein [Zestomonas insulae]|uniref:secretin N-terminal domain-containing protein n=1 Tax=Zestomonas insulae TaxID=2809017 RepID=UPI001EF4A9C7|nr:secretin N-terminal domain-containing protein [Pseudomonas insulae]
MNRLSLSLLSLVLLGGCASKVALDDGKSLVEQGQYEAGLARLEDAVRADPRDTTAQIALTTMRGRVIQSLLAQADSLRTSRDFATAQLTYQRVLGIEPNNSRARDGLYQIEQLRHVDDMLRQGQAALRRGDLVGARRQVQNILNLDPQYEPALQLEQGVQRLQAQNLSPYPQLRSRLDRPVTLEFRDASLKVIFEVLAQTSGLNFIFDKDVRPDLKATIFVRQVAIEDAVELLLQQGQLHQKVVNDNTIVIYPDSPQKIKDYQELVMRTFYLTSVDANTAMNMVKTMLKTRDVFIDERLNTLTMRDTPDAVRMAEKLFQSQDQSDPEVVLEVEVMEVARQRILDLGLQWPNTFGVLNDEGNPVGILDQLKGLDSGRISISPSPQAKINAKDNDINTLASPVIRVSNREQARVHIGQRVPIVSATSTPSTQGPVITESITYLDVGLKLEVQPTVHLNNEVAIKIALEVSNATPLAPTQQGTIPVQVDTRNAQTTLRLHDGETQVLAGLMRNDHFASGNKIPGLGDIPGIGRLFGSNQDTVGKSELVLAITPRVVRNLPYQSPSDMEFATGTETSLRTRPMRVPVAVAAADASPLAEPNLSLPGTSALPHPAVDADTGELLLHWVGPAQMRAGEEAVIELQAEAGHPLRSSTLQVAYDPARLKVLEVVEGDLLRSDANRTSFTPRLDENNGVLVATQARSGNTGATGAGGLLRLRVRALESGERGSPIRLLSFSGVGQGDSLVSAALPPPQSVTVMP